MSIRIAILSVTFAPTLGALSAEAQDSEFVKLSNGRLLAPAPMDKPIEVMDGDTLWVGLYQIRLYGIDAVEPKQSCDLAGKSKSYCHLEASKFLRAFTTQPGFVCEFHVKDGENKPWINHGRYVATCYSGKTEVNAAMVSSGWAFAANTSYGNEYKKFEQSARAKRIGVFATNAIAPWAWRKAQREDDDCTCP